MSTETEISGSLSLDAVAKKFLGRVLDRARGRGIVFSDIDGTLVDSSLRFKIGKSFSEIEELMDEIEDPPKERVVQQVKSLVNSGLYLVLVTGRRRSLKTAEQIRRLGFSDFFFLRNSKFYNPTLSSKIFKTALAESVCRLRLKGFGREVVFVEDRPDILESILETVSQYERVRERARVDTLDGVFFFWL